MELLFCISTSLKIGICEQAGLTPEPQDGADTPNGDTQLDRNSTAASGVNQACEEMARRAQQAHPEIPTDQLFAESIPVWFTGNAGIVFGESWPQIKLIKLETWAADYSALEPGCTLISIDGQPATTFAHAKAMLQGTPFVKTDPPGFVMVWRKPSPSAAAQAPRKEQALRGAYSV